MYSSENNFYEFSKKGADIYLTPKAKHTHTLIFMHGLGDSAQGFYDFFTETSSPAPATMKIVLPTAPIRPVTINAGMKMASWFDFKSFSVTEANFNNVIGVNQADESTERIKKIINEEIAVLGGDSKKIFVGGFSQGAAMALKTSLTFDQPLGGILSFSGFLFFGIAENEKNKTIPILISHGKEDPLLAYALCAKSYEKLDSKAHQIRTEILNNLEHSLDHRSIAVFKEFLTKYAV